MLMATKKKGSKRGPGQPPIFNEDDQAYFLRANIFKWQGNILQQDSEKLNGINQSVLLRAILSYVLKLPTDERIRIYMGLKK